MSPVIARVDVVDPHHDAMSHDVALGSGSIPPSVVITKTAASPTASCARRSPAIHRSAKLDVSHSQATAWRTSG